jgi:hypothetical protein
MMSFEAEVAKMTAKDVSQLKKYLNDDYILKDSMPEVK